MNTPLRRLATVVVVMFLVLMGATTWVQFVQAPTLNADQRNVRTLYREYGNVARADRRRRAGRSRRRCRSTTRSATSASTPTAPLYAPVTGFYSVVYGAHGHRGVR